MLSPNYQFSAIACYCGSTKNGTGPSPRAQKGRSPRIVAMAFTIAGTANDGPFKPHDLRVSTRHPRSTIRGRSWLRNPRGLDRIMLFAPLKGASSFAPGRQEDVRLVEVFPDRFLHRRSRGRLWQMKSPG